MDALKKGGQEGDEVCGKMCKVPAFIMRAMLNKYVERCTEIYNIAFIQWRNMFPSAVRYDAEEIEELLAARIRNLINSKHQNAVATKETQEQAAVSEKFGKRYKMKDEHQEKWASKFLISSFEQIGWQDPFPNDCMMHAFKDKGHKCDCPKTMVPANSENLVYPESRYIKGMIPFVIYIPKKEMMMKMIRACFGVKKVEDLWFNQKLEEEPSPAEEAAA